MKHLVESEISISTILNTIKDGPYLGYSRMGEPKILKYITHNRQ